MWPAVPLDCSALNPGWQIDFFGGKMNIPPLNNRRFMQSMLPKGPLKWIASSHLCWYYMSILHYSSFKILSDLTIMHLGWIITLIFPSAFIRKRGSEIDGDIKMTLCGNQGCFAMALELGVLRQSCNTSGFIKTKCLSRIFLSSWSPPVHLATDQIIHRWRKRDVTIVTRC